MKYKKSIITLLILICMLGVTGCGKAEKDTSLDGEKDRVHTKTETTAESTESPAPEQTEAPTPVPTVEPTSEPTEEPEPKQTNIPTGDVPDEPGASSDPDVLLSSGNNLHDIFMEVANEVGKPELVTELNESTGYISADADTVDELLKLCTIDVDDLSYENIDNATGVTFYHFEMTHENPLLEVPSDDELAYVTELVYDDEAFYLMFGAKEDAEDIEILAQEGITIEYWAIATEVEGSYILVPFFAGNEENGYYVVRTNCEMSDMDMSETMTLAEQNISFATTSEPEPDQPEPNQPLPALTSDEFSFEITGEVIEEGLAAFYCKLENGYDKEIFLDDEIIILNGEDITDNTLFTFWVEGSSSVEEDPFSIVDYTLVSGDTLQISFTVVDNETYEPIGTVEYSYTIS